MLDTPIDTDTNLGALLDAFPVGTKFSQRAVGALLDRPPHWVRAFLQEVRAALLHCPEGPQLCVARGAHGGHWFE